MVAHAAKVLGQGRETLVARIKRSDHLTKVLADIRYTNLDFAESKLMELMAKGTPSAIIFYLKCQGKERGYVERVESTGKDGKDLNVLPIISPPRATSMEEWLDQNRKEKAAS